MGVELLRYMINPAMARRDAHVSPAPDLHHGSGRRGVATPGAPPAAGKTGGRPRKYPMREVLNGLQYGLRAGCAWRLMPHDLPHWPTAYQACRAWRQDGTWRRLHDQLRDEVRTRMGRHT